MPEDDERWRLAMLAEGPSFATWVAAGHARGVAGVAPLGRRQYPARSLRTTWRKRSRRDSFRSGPPARSPQNVSPSILAPPAMTRPSCPVGNSSSARHRPAPPSCGATAILRVPPHRTSARARRQQPRQEVARPAASRTPTGGFVHISKEVGILRAKFVRDACQAANGCSPRARDSRTPTRPIEIVENAGGCVTRSPFGNETILIFWVCDSP